MPPPIPRVVGVAHKWILHTPLLRLNRAETDAGRLHLLPVLLVLELVHERFGLRLPRHIVHVLGYVARGIQVSPLIGFCFLYV